MMKRLTQMHDDTHEYAEEYQRHAYDHFCDEDFQYYSSEDENDIMNDRLEVHSGANTIQLY